KMAARGSGSIVNVGSMAGQIGLAGGAAYGATKATLASITRAWAAEFSPLVSESTPSPPDPSSPRRCEPGPRLSAPPPCWGRPPTRGRALLKPSIRLDLDEEVC